MAGWLWTFMKWNPIDLFLAAPPPQVIAAAPDILMIVLYGQTPQPRNITTIEYESMFVAGKEQSFNPERDGIKR